MGLCVVTATAQPVNAARRRSFSGNFAAPLAPWSATARQGTVVAVARRASAFWVVLACLVGGGGCTPTAQVYQSKVFSEGKFGFVFGQGSEWYAYDTLRLAETGDCYYTFAEVDGPTSDANVFWRGAEFRVDKAKVDALKTVLNEVGFLTLQPHYVVPKAEDGQQHFATMRAGTRTHTVRVDSLESPDTGPAAMVQIAEFVEGELLSPVRNDFGSAPVISSEEAALGTPTEEAD